MARKDQRPVTGDSGAESGSPADARISLGSRRPKGGPVTLSSETIGRHLAIVGAGGPGRTTLETTLCSGLAAHGVPVIVVDESGDLTSIARARPVRAAREGTASGDVAAAGGPEVVVWTPASSLGIPLCLSPLDFEFPTGTAHQRAREISLLASAIAQLLGYDPGRTPGRLAQALLELVITWCADRQLRPRTFQELSDFVSGGMPAELARDVDTIIDAESRDVMARKLRTLGMGARRLLFSHGLPLDVDTLLGREDASAAGTEPPPLRVSVIHLGSLPTDEEKTFFVSE